jgi:hypothetical protein
MPNVETVLEKHKMVEGALKFKVRPLNSNEKLI